jgi:hypothetical protein
MVTVSHWHICMSLVCITALGSNISFFIAIGKGRLLAIRLMADGN